METEQKGTQYKVWFTSDTHFSGKSILFHKPERRVAAGITLEELQADRDAAMLKHDEWLIDLWNKTIKKKDFVYILGDFCMGNKKRTEYILGRLNGRKYLIRGNHDKSCAGLERYFEWVGDIKEAKFNHGQYPFIDKDETFCLEMCHYPLFAWNRRPHGTCHIHGHTHGYMCDFNDRSVELRFDIGFDSKLAEHKILDLETIYKKMIEIRESTNSSTFEEHTEKIMISQGFRA
jgi:calcineurin-like phosphoesterase family protein